MAMSRCKQWIGPLALGGSLCLLCAANTINIFTAFTVASTLYVTGVVPESDFFPSAWYRSNIFSALYRLYCSDRIGYKYLRTRMHPRRPEAHSDYRHGVRALSGAPRPSAPQGIDTSRSAAFYARGGGLVDLEALAKEWGSDDSDSNSDSKGVVVVPVPSFADNYAYLILSFAARRCAAVDPADPDALLAALREVRALTRVDFVLTDVLTTHKHWDHAGGNQELRQLAASGAAADCVGAGLRLYGSLRDRPHGCTDFVSGGSVLRVAGGAVCVSVLHSPGHTSGSVLFLAGDARGGERLALFTGDCIFCGGCGGMFEVEEVEEVLTTLDALSSDAARTHPATGRRVDAADVLCYVGHEYTESLLDGVMKAITPKLSDPGAKPSEAACKFYAELRSALSGTKKLRSVGATGLPACTVPSTLAVEQRTNALLTLRRQVLEDMRHTRNPGSALSIAIYSSLEREMPP